MLVALCSLVAGCGDGLAAAVLAPGGELERFSVQVDLAETAEERERGLADRASLGPHEGLLIRFPVEGEVCIDNGGVDFAIDVVYARGDGGVVAIERQVAAGDRTSRCHAPVREVLEVAAGNAASARVGDTLVVR